MRRLFWPFLIIALLVFTQAAFAEAAEASGGRIPPSDILKQVRPEYPLEARRKHEGGSGLLILHVDRTTGKVTSVTVYKSTGYKILDDAGIRAFIKWRFRSGVTSKVKMPISFKVW